MNNIGGSSRAVLRTTIAAWVIAASVGSAFAQEDEPADEPLDEIMVVGSQIRGTKATAALPVTVVTAEDIAATGASSGNELLRTIPQLGNVSFNSANFAGTSNSARGDVNSISLRNFGPGDTLLLINGRRTTRHPITQELNSVPVFSYNSNAIPVAGVKSLEVLRDGASAIYGTDAVAGVINVVLQDDFHGATVEAQYGGVEGTNMREGRLTALLGMPVQGDRGNLTLFATAERRSALLTSDQDYTATADRRILFAGTEFANAASLDSRSTSSAWGVFQTPASAGVIRSNGVAVTGPTGLFHIAPQTNPTCGVVIGSGVCLDAGAQNINTDRNLRLDPLTFRTTVIPQNKRYNLYSTFNYRLNDSLTFFAEGSYYHAVSKGTTGPGTVGISAVTITIPANSYYNPFGPTLLANGQPNPNRLPGLSIPASGLPVTINNYGLVDVGDIDLVVKNSQYRLLGGLRGELFGFDWESAALYSEAKSTDTYDALSSTRLQQALARTTPDAYNPFNGGTVAAPSFGDATPSGPAALADLRIPLVRASKTTLALWDFKINRSDLVALPAGTVGVAAGIEIRRETYSDNRDRRLDGSAPYIDPLTGIKNLSDVPGASASLDVAGKRTVASAFAELAIPLISPDMNIPLAHRIDLQLAGRAERYSDVGSVAKPKIAASWDIVPGVRLRSSWSQGFQAPNLEVINTVAVFRTAGFQDFIFCEADLRAKRISTFNACSQNRPTRVVRAGNPDLKPQLSTSFSYGIVLEPKFIPDRFGRLTLTADLWRIKQRGVIGTFGQNNALVLDYLLRLQGSSNPLLHRLAPTPEEAAMFAGTGIAPVGQVDFVDERYTNQNPQDARGVDLGLFYRLRTAQLGSFGLNVNVSVLNKFYQAPSAEAALLLQAKAAGTINSSTPIVGGGDLVGQNGNVKWRGSGSFSWSYEGFDFTWFSTYTGKFYDTALTYATGGFYVAKDTLLHNVSLAYTFDGTWLKGTRVLVGARNVFDKDPPLVPTGGYNAAVYNPYGRYLYINLKKSF